MIRVFLFFAVLFVFALGFAWMADLPGVISISWEGYTYEKPPVVVAVMAGLAFVALLFVVWLVLAILRSPRIATRFFQRRRRDKGYDALSHGLIALGTGNAKAARRFGLEADKLLKNEPAARLLLAQTAQLAGRNDEARGRFEAMLAAPETKALGLHGLYVEAEKQGEPVAARHYAEAAASLSANLEWAGQAVLGYQAVSNDWEAAIATLERNYGAKMLDKKAYRRQRAVLLTARAMQLEDNEPDRAFGLAKEAHGLAHGLVPASVLAARLATRRGDFRKASKFLETTWRLSPHPDIADAYAHVRPGDSAVDRVKRVKALTNLRANTAAGAMAHARAAIEAREFDEAREQLKKVLRSEPVRGAFLMMAELEEAEHGDRGRMRDWLARAVRAPLDPAWVADGVVSREWAPVSPVTGRIDAFEWTTPTGLPDAETGTVLEDSLFEAPALPVAAAPTAPTAAAPAQPLDVNAEEPSPVLAEDEDKTLDLTPAAKPVTAEPATGTTAADENTAAEAPVEKSEAVEEAPKEAADTAEPPKEAAASRSAADGTTDDFKEPAGEPIEKKADASPAPVASASKSTAKDTDLSKPITFPFASMPDDPGPEEDEEPKKPNPRFFN